MQELINIGEVANDGTGDPNREAFRKTNDNTSKLFGHAVVQVAASNASQLERDTANYVCTGTNDEVQLQQAVAALEAAGGGQLQLSSGRFVLDGPPVEVKASNITIRGTGRGTIIDRNWQQGTSPLYMIEFKGIDVDNRITGCGLHEISVRTSAPYAETPAGLIGDGTQSFLHAFAVKGFQVSGIYAERAAFVVDVRSSIDVSISRIFGYQVFGCVSVITSERVTISDIAANESQSVVDLGDCRYVTMTNLVGLASTVRNTDEGLDIGGSQHISISNFAFKGYYRGIYLKQEQAPGTPNQVTDVVIGNGLIEGSTLHGIRCYNADDLSARYGPLKISNVEIVGSGNSTGITVFDYGVDVQITDNLINVGGVGIQVDGSQGVTIDNNRIKTGVSDNGITCQPVTTTGGSGVDALSDYSVTNNRIQGGKIGVYCEKITGGRIAGNNVSGCAEHGMHLLDIAKLRVHGNQVDSVQQEGIWVQWVFDTFLDSTLRKVNASIGENVVSDYGLQVGTVWNGVLAQISGVTGAAYTDFSMNNNDCVLTAAASPATQLQNGVRVDFTIDLDYASVQGNLVNVTGAPLSSRNTFLTNCLVRDNVGAADIV